MNARALRLTTAALAVGLASAALAAQEPFKFKSGVELVNVTATVTGRDGRFLAGLDKDDFIVFDNGERQPITHFSSERAPVSLGILLDASGSMADDKMAAARRAIQRFVTDLLDEEDEIFFMAFNEKATLRQDWTHDRRDVIRALSGVNPVGGTAMYDAVAQALPIAAGGKHAKKALLVISDGRDADSEVKLIELRQAIKESEVLVYALGIDATAESGNDRRGTPIPQPTPGGRRPRPPIRIPGIGDGGWRFPFALPQFGGFGRSSSSDERVNAPALRELTDDTGGRTEIIRKIDDLPGATSRIADELSQQYSLGYIAPGPTDGRWHAIRVELAGRTATVRARAGYFAS
jgi:VWFA-related protein